LKEKKTKRWMFFDFF